MTHPTTRRSLVILLAAIALITACATVPLTGRKQLSLIPASQMQAMSYQQYTEVIQASQLSKDAAQTAMVKRVGARIQGAVERYMTQEGLGDQLAGYAWEFNLIESDDVNAWCMPGGKVAFYTGILPVCKDETGIAVVMGHEVAHAIAEHGGERMSQGLLAQLGGMALSEALQSKPQATQQLWMTAFAVGAQYGALLPYSRLQEGEADQMGLIFMAMAGYDPRQAPAFWERMSAQGGASPPEFMSTHPSDETRIRKLNEHLPKALEYYRP
ncbi:MAG TPA: M48 family metallopeptidase [Candidatus Krumholzibacteria bacterium]|nr:M48 family metallopeptidase [Candidatus Krumholzibacteria bacterium]HPD70402.1 M48 family metallopeptidase [Candidatus Krumholzibacteria bacterium]HRY39898.1 M48 family metallopeptidase [Candidatus Krumholzibacteria bacterium]